jgi:hypothetical protein
VAVVDGRSVIGVLWGLDLVKEKGTCSDYARFLVRGLPPEIGVRGQSLSHETECASVRKIRNVVPDFGEDGVCSADSDAVDSGQVDT